MLSARLGLVCLLLSSGFANAQTNFCIQDVHRNGDGSVTITWPVVPTWPYHVMFADSPDGTWQEFPDGKLTAGTNDVTLCYTDTNAPTASQRFYKVRFSRTQLIMSLVLDRSGSMVSNGGGSALPSAVSMFVDFFNDNIDDVALVSFASSARVDVPIGHPFKAAIKAAVSNLVFSGWTVSEQGLTNGLVQNQSVVVPPGQDAVKVIVFFTDGLANTFQYTFNCGVRNIAPDRTLYDPNTGALATGGCVVPSTIPSIAGGTISTSDQCSLTGEGELRAAAVAEQARLQGNTIYAVGLGSPIGPGTCGRPPINLAFLQEIANDPASPTFNPSQPVGEAVIADSAVELEMVFVTIASKITVY